MLVSCYLKWWKHLLRHVWQVFWLLWLMGCTILWTIGRNYTEGSSECFLNQYCLLLLNYIWFKIPMKSKICSLVRFLQFWFYYRYLNTWKPLFLTSLKDVMLTSWHLCFCFLVHNTYILYELHNQERKCYLFVKGEYSFMNSRVMNSWFIYLVISFQHARYV